MKFNPRLVRICAICAICIVAFLCWMSMFSEHSTCENRKNALAEEIVDEKDVKCQRIVSLAPSITESLYALGLGNNVVGVTRYCNYPREAISKMKVGGYYDPNYEVIAFLKPDLVVVLSDHREQARLLNNLGIEVITYKYKRVYDILDSIERIGDACGVASHALEVTENIRKRIERTGKLTRGRPRPRVMVSMGRNMGTGSMKDAFISGKNGFYNDIISLAGGINAYSGQLAFPAISREGIIVLNPDIIIDMVPDLADRGWSEEKVLDEWRLINQVNAVKKGEVYVFGQDYVVIPGPRFILIVEQMAEVLHSDGRWG